MSAVIKRVLIETQNERERLGNFSDEIRQGILNLCDEAAFDKTIVESDLQEIIERGALESNPGATVSLLLFRKYAEITNDIIMERQNQTEISFNRVQFDPSTFILPDVDVNKLVGTLALGEKIFWLRLITAMFAFISMVVMASIPGIGGTKLCPKVQHCYYRTSGCFHYQRNFLFLVVIAAVIVAHNLFLAGYYLLPTNENKKKLVPGLCIMSSFPSFLTPLMDIILLIISLIAGILGSWTLDHVQFFSMYIYGGSLAEGYYTIASLYAELSRMKPVCVLTSEDPSPRMSASIAMMFLTICLMCLCFVASFNHFRKQRKLLSNNDDDEENYNPTCDVEMTTRDNNAENARVNLESLGDEIRQGIVNLGAAGNFDKAAIESEIQAIIAKSALGNNSDPSVGLLLFRKYADIANEIAYEKKRIETTGKISAFILQDVNKDRLVGSKALGENVFWLRVVTSVFAFISMVVMASIPGIGDSNFCPSFNCSVFTMYSDNDCFNQKPYWFLIATAAAIAALNLFLACYYLLSTNDNGKKFIPGVCVLAECPSFVNPLVDFILLASSFAAAIAGSVTLQKTVYFYSGSISGYYTIASVYEQFTNTDPKCLNESDDPSPRMTASIIVMFLTACLMSLCFAASFNHYRKEPAAAPVNDKGVKVLEESSADEV